ncbi:MAG: peptidylprolyl isomerase, partial [Candidatus Cloacimonadota bacterium]|nr:peptidylprolyl isomerase [Candidatus Cloacimonadota bacterium]
MLKKMRSLSRPIIWVTAILFIGGMGTMGISQIFTEHKQYVGEIAGNKIQYDNFYKMVQNAYSDYRQNNPDEVIDEEKMRGFNDQTWDQLIQKIVLEKAIKKYNIKVTDQEVAAKIVNDPPPMLTSHESFQTDGKFDKAKYLQALQNPEIDWSWLESYDNRLLLYEKFQNMLNANIIVTEEEVKKDFIGKNEKAKAEIMIFSPELIDSVVVTDAEIEKYYYAFKDDYWKKAQRKLKYVSIPLIPTVEDIKHVENLINDIYKMLEEGDNFDELAKDYSQGPSAPKGGDLGWFGKGKMVPEFEEKAFSMKSGEFSKPIKTQFGWHIIKLVDTRTKDDVKEVHAKHILLKEEPGADARKNQERFANDFYDQCQVDSFDVIAKKFGYEVKESKEFGDERSYIPGIGQAKILLEFAFSHDLNQICEPYIMKDNNYVIAQIIDKSNAHYETINEVEDAIVPKIEKIKKMNLVKPIADSIAKQINADNFTTIAEENELKI